VGPIAARDLFLDGRGYDLLADCGAVVILAREKTASPPPVAATVRLRLIAGGAVLVPVSENVTHVVFVACVDPQRKQEIVVPCFGNFVFSQVPVIPCWLINFVTKQLASHFFQLLRDRAVELPEVYKQRISENRMVYGEVELRVKEYLDKQSGK
jgi:hypothetical protein